MGANLLRPPTRAVKIVLRHDGLQKVRKQFKVGTDKHLADLTGVNASQMWRVLNDVCDPGIQFVAGFINTFGVEHFFDLFDIVPKADDDRTGAA